MNCAGVVYSGAPQCSLSIRPLRLTTERYSWSGHGMSRYYIVFLLLRFRSRL